MQAVVIGLVATSAVAGVAHTGVSSKPLVEASRYSALAASENLGKLDTTAGEAFQRAPQPSRSTPFGSLRSLK